MQTAVLPVERQVSEGESPVGPWLRRAARPGFPVCGRPGSEGEVEAQAEAQERAW